MKSLLLLCVAMAVATPAPVEAQAPPAAPTEPPPSGGSHGGPPGAQNLPVEPDFVAWAPVLDREALVQAVLARNPSLEAARLAWLAAAEIEPQARALPDPMVAYGVAPLSIGSGEVDFGEEARFEQDLPFPGKRRLAAGRARAEAQAMGHDLEALRRELAVEASTTFDAYYEVRREIDVTAHHRGLLEDFQRAAAGRYAAGLVSQADPLQAEVEVAHLDRMLLELGAEQRVLTARLNALLHRSLGLPLPPPPSALPLPAGPPPPVRELTARALAGRPEIASLDAEIQALEAAVALARLARRPDFEAMASYNSMWSDREHRWMVGVALNLPVRKERLQALASEAELRLASARSRRASLVDRVSFEVEEAVARLDEQRRIVELYASRILPAAGDQVRAALAGFKTGTVEFVAVIEAEQNHRHAELGYHQALAAYHTGRAALARAVGEIAGLEAEASPARGELP